MCISYFQKIWECSFAVYLIVVLWMLEWQTLLPLIPEDLCATSPPFLTIFPQFTLRCKRFPKLILIHQFVSLNFVPFPFLIFNCLTVSFPPTKEFFGFYRLFNTISAWYKQTWFSDCLCCCCKYPSCRRADRTAWIVENIRPIYFVNP